MAEWVLRNAPKTEPKEPNIQVASDESFGEKAKRVGSNLGLNVLQGVEGIIGFLPQLLLGKKPPHPWPSEIIKELSGITPEYEKPTNFGERVIYRGAKSLPAVAGGGLPALARLGLGATAGAAAGELFNAPEWAQDLIQLGTEGAAAYKQGKIPSVKSVINAKDQLARAAVKPNEGFPANAVNEAIEGVEKLLTKEADRKLARKVTGAISTVGKSIMKGNLNPVDAIDLQKTLYRFGNELKPSIAADYVNPITKAINKFFTSYGAKNPEFYKHLTGRNKLVMFKNMNTYLEQLVHAAGLTKIPVIKALSPILRTAERSVRGLGNTEAVKYYFKGINALAENNPTVFFNNMNHLKDLVLPEKEAQKLNELQDSGWVIRK